VSSESRLTQTQQKVLGSVLPEGSNIAPERIEIGDRTYPIEPSGIVRFRQDDGYAQSFAFQWTTYQLVQYDSHNKTSLYGGRFKRETGWGRADGEVILEAGCGAGAFTQHILGTGASVVSVDFSTAVDVAAQHNKSERAVFCQADILDLPFSGGSFDGVFCHGVLQHTPSPEKAFHSLARVLKPGGRLSIDVYKKDLSIRPWKSKRLWRWLTTRMEHERLLALLRWYIPKWLPIDTRLKSIPLLGNYFGAVIPCWNYFRRKELTQEQLVTWAIMDTFDALSPKYDIPATLGDVRRWFRDAAFTQFEVRDGGNGVVGNGVKA
jgi:SAM-dependent methyltransferase